MLWNSSVIKGYAIAASNGRLGTVSDFLFDDASWRIRWLVVDTGHWLSGRKVLLPPSALGQLEPARQEFSVKLTMQQVKDSPDLDRDRPVSRQMETNIHNYYGWSPYWTSDIYMGGYGYIGGAMAVPSLLEHRQREEDVVNIQQSDGDPDLRSIEVVTGYHIHAADGEIGHLEDFIVEDADWSIRYFVVDTKNWWPGKKIVILPRSVTPIDWNDGFVNVDVDRQKIKDSPAYDPSTTIDRVFEDNYRRHYGDLSATDRP
jgi:PRC-barrel domain